MVSPFLPIAFNNKVLMMAKQKINKKNICIFIVKTQGHGSTRHDYFTSSME